MYARTNGGTLESTQQGVSTGGHRNRAKGFADA